jgi:SAM-dependent methyltransferase
MVSFGLLGQLLLSSSLTQKGFFLVQLTRYDIFGKALIPKSFSADYSGVRLSSTRTDAAARTALHQTFILSAASILNSLGGFLPSSAYMMVRMDKSFIQSQLGILSVRKQELQWLVEHEIKANRVANFGCSIGGETLALAWALNANEAIGIDRDKVTIQQAESTFSNIREEIAKISRSIHYYPNTAKEGDKIWWKDEVPDFFKRTIMHDDFQVKYIVGDITKHTSLESNYYDIAYCDFVLHHIWYDGLNGKTDTQHAVSEMMRVVRRGGIIAAMELLQYDEKPKLNFKSLFEDIGLKVIHEKIMRVENGLNGMFAEYLCEKPELS